MEIFLGEKIAMVMGDLAKDKDRTREGAEMGSAPNLGQLRYVSGTPVTNHG
jgi:hypothetical protein